MFSTGNGCVVIVLVASRSKMDVPRFLVCNLAMADFCMGLYLGFLAVVDAATLGDFRRFAIDWQFSAGCQVNTIGKSNKKSKIQNPKSKIRKVPDRKFLLFQTIKALLWSWDFRAVLQLVEIWKIFLNLDLLLEFCFNILNKNEKSSNDVNEKAIISFHKNELMTLSWVRGT